jgi:hypothetical protein
LLLAFEVGMYCYFNLASAYSMMFIHAFFANDRVRESIYHFSEHYLPGREVSILSGLKTHVSLLSLLFFFALQTQEDTLSSQAWIKWGVMTVIGLAIIPMGARASLAVSNALVKPERPHHAFLVQNMVQHTVLLLVCMYLYPCLVQALDTTFGQETTPTTAAALDTLGLENNAAPAEIKNRIRSLLLQNHPDHSSNPAAKELTQKILEAARVLKKQIQHRAP